MTGAPRHASRLDATLADAARAYRARDDAAFRRLLEEAVALAPERIDIRHCLASHHIQVGRPEAALTIYRAIDADAPRDADTLFRLAHWLRFAGEETEAAAVRSRLQPLRPDMNEWLSRLWASLDAWFARPVSDQLPDALGRDGKKAAILVLGYALAADGSARPRLIARLEKGLEAAKRFPDAAVVVSGGVPRGGTVEAEVMRDWLLARGVAADRIWEEGYSRDCVENLIYSRQLLTVNGVEDVLIVTAAGNVRRVGAAMEVLGRVSGWEGGVTATSSSGEYAEYVDNGADRLKAYREVLRVYGIPMMAAYPHLVER